MQTQIDDASGAQLFLRLLGGEHLGRFSVAASLRGEDSSSKLLGRREVRNMPDHGRLSGTRDALLLGLAQCVLYVLIILNTRAITGASLHWAACSDALIATLNFGVLRRIARLEEGAAGFVGYLAGSVFGTIAGLALARAFGI
jgi:hypothetical protein